MTAIMDLTRERIEVLREQRDELKAQAENEALSWDERWTAWRKLARVEGYIAEEQKELEDEENKRE